MTKKSPRPNKALEETAHHEAGHAVAAIVCRRPFKYVSIDRGEDDLGHVHFREPPASFNPEFNNDMRSRDLCERDALVSLAGPAAEAHFARRKRWKGACRDVNSAATILEYMCGGPEECQAYFDWIAVRARMFVRNSNRWPQIEAVARELLALPPGRRKLSSGRVRAICRSALDRALEQARERLRQGRAAEPSGADASGSKKCKTCDRLGEIYVTDVNGELRGVFCEPCAMAEAERLNATRPKRRNRTMLRSK